MPPPLADAKNATDLETLDSVDWRKPSATQVGYMVRTWSERAVFFSDAAYAGLFHKESVGNLGNEWK